MCTATSRRPLGANDFSKFTINVKEPNYTWIKYVSVALFVVAIRFLCCC